MVSQPEHEVSRRWPGVGPLAAELERLAATRRPTVDPPYGLVVVSALAALLSVDGAPAARHRFAAVGEALPGAVHALAGRPVRNGAPALHPYREPAFAVLVPEVDPDGLGQFARRVRRSAEAVAGGDVMVTHLRSWPPAGDGPVTTGAALLVAAVRAVIDDQVLPLAHRLRRLEERERKNAVVGPDLLVRA